MNASKIATLGKNSTPMKLWDEGATAGLENIYLNRVAEEHRKKLGELFLPTKEGRYLDAGCGAGSMFEFITREIQPAEVYAVDWSKVMLEKARLETERLQPFSKTNFAFPCIDHARVPGWIDLTEPLVWPDGFFDGCISNQVVCYLVCGWKRPIEELARVIKPGGYLYLGTLLNHWGFTRVLWKHFLPEFLRAPVVSIQGLKYRRILDKISKELKKRGAQSPSREELIDYLETLGFKEIKVVPTYWGGSVALRARVKL